jgi:hypothetical protein
LNSDNRPVPVSGASRNWLFAGTFMVALALLAFEVATVRTINFTVGPSHIYIAIALAMLGLSGAGSFLSLFDIRAMRFRRETVLFWLCVAIALLLVASHFFVAEVKDDLNSAIAAAGRDMGILGIVRVTLSQGLLSALSIGLSLSLPYFLFGALLTVLFVTTDDKVYGRLYASDLIGAATGCVVAILLMELTSYAFSVTAPAAVVLLGAAFYAWPASRRLGMAGLAGAALLAILPALDWYAHAVEPRADPNYLVRDYDYRETVVETGRDWNSYTRVGALEWRGENARPYAMMSLSNGDGMAWVLPYDPDRAAPMSHRATASAMLLEPPERALVMFAGVGADMMALHEYGAGHVTGVELNGTLVEGGRSLDVYRTAEFLDTDEVDLVIAEGRVFLERDDNLYDLVLMSWSGATASYYAGALGGTTQFLFTYEGLSAALGHVAPGGYAVLLQLNKINALATLERYVRENGHAPLSRSVVILFRPGNENVGWDRPWDDSPLLFKPSGWTDGDVERIVREGRRRGLEVAYAPGLPPHKDFTVYEQVVQAPDVDARIAALAAETDLRFGLVTDNRPFYLDLFPNRNYLDGEYWSRFFSGQIDRADHIAHTLRVLFVATVSLFAVAIILGPLAFARGPARNRRSLYHLIYFFCLGGGFMILEIAIMQRAGLLFGNPGLTIAIVLAGIILFTGLGSLASDGTTRVALSLRTVALLCVLYPLFLGFLLDSILDAMLAWPLLLKATALMLAIAPGGFVLGQLFPRGLAMAQRDDSALVPWAWAINGAMGTVTAGVAPLLAQAWGFDMLFFVAAALYAIILLLPPYNKARAS